MKYLLLILIITLNCEKSHGQEDTLRSLINEIQLRQSNIGKTTMISLNSWAIGNITYGTIANFNSTGEAKYFHQMNAIWNVVNLGIGIPGIIGAYKKKSPMSFQEVNNYQHRLEKIYFINAGLDVAYITGGVALRLFGSDKPTEVRYRLQGYGNSLIMQGAYLLIHDIAAILIHKTNTRLLNKAWEHVHLSSNGFNLKLEFH